VEVEPREPLCRLGESGGREGDLEVLVLASLHTEKELHRPSARDRPRRREPGEGRGDVLGTPGVPVGVVGMHGAEANPRGLLVRRISLRAPAPISWAMSENAGRPETESEVPAFGPHPVTEPPDIRLPLVLRGLAAVRAHHLEYGRRHVAGFVLIGAALACAALAGVAWAAGFESVGTLLISPQWQWFPIAFGGEIAAYAGYTLALREVTRTEPASTLRFRDTLALVATGFGVFIARGGFTADYEVLQERCEDDADARIRVLGLGALEYAVLAPVTCVAACFLLLNGSQISTGFTLPWAIGVPAGLILALALVSRRTQFDGRSGWRGGVAAGLGALDVLNRLARRPGQGLVAAFGMTLYWAGDAFCLWACLYGFLGRPLPVSALIVGYATGYALSRRTLPLAGAGVVEALLPFALLWVSLPLAAGMLAVLAYRFFNLWLPLLPAVLGHRHLRAGHA